MGLVDGKIDFGMSETTSLGNQLKTISFPQIDYITEKTQQLYFQWNTVILFLTEENISTWKPHLEQNYLIQEKTDMWTSLGNEISAFKKKYINEYWYIMGGVWGGNKVHKCTYMSLVSIRILFPQWRESLKGYEKNNNNYEGFQFKLV